MPEFATPDFPRTHDYDKLYEPAEDSFLVLDTLSLPAERDFLRSHLSDVSCPVILDIGTGSGIILTFILQHAARLLGNGNVIGIGTDLNPNACLAAEATLQENAVLEKGSVIRSNLTSSIRPGSVDILLCNPPYVPTETVPEGYSEETALELAWAGGADGMEVTNRLLEDIPVVLGEKGVAYVLVCAGNHVDRVMESIENMDWNVVVAGTSGRKAGWEVLSILRIWRK